MEAKMSNIAQGKAECYIRIYAKGQVLYFSYSKRWSNSLTIIKNYANTITIKPTRFNLDDSTSVSLPAAKTIFNAVTSETRFISAVFFKYLIMFLAL